MTALQLYREAVRRGLTLDTLDGETLAVIPAERCTREFADVLRQHKRELLDLLEVKAYCLPQDCVPWLHIARQVLRGEFEGADGSTVASLSIGLKATTHPLCRRALARLQADFARPGRHPTQPGSTASS